MFSSLRGANPPYQEGASMSKAECRAIRVQSVAHWRGMSKLARASFISKTGRLDPQPCTDADDEGEGGIHGIEAAAEKRSPWMKLLGTPEWPVDPAVVMSELELAVPTHQHGYGVWSRFQSIRSEVQRKGLICDRDVIPRDREIVVDSACFQIHPGLCVTNDAEIYSEATPEKKMRR